MSEWWTYSLSDLLLFSPRVYYRLLELHNEALWPLQLLMGAVGLAMIFGVRQPPGPWTRFVITALGVIWIWIGWSFFWQRYATINWAAVYIAPIAVLEGLLLLWIGLQDAPPSFQRRRLANDVASLVILGFAVIFYPFIAPIMGRQWLAAEIFGIAPDPTAVATLSVLALAEARARLAAMIIPCGWCIITGLTLWTMGAGDFFITPLCALVVLGVALTNRRQ